MKIALISCGGDLPVKVLEQLQDSQHHVYVIGFNEVKTALDTDLRVSLGQVGKIFDFLKKNNIKHIMLAGAMTRPNLWKLRFDWRGLKFSFQIIRFLKKGDDALLRFVCRYIQSYNASIEYGQKILNHLSEFDIGQSIAISDQVVVAIEALDGTDAMLQKVAMIDPKRMQGLSKPIFIKMRKKNQLNFVDLPTIGVQTIENLAKAGFVAAAFEAKGCLIIDIDQVIACAKKHNIILIGFNNYG